MITLRLQRWLDTLRDTSPQRWVLGSAAVLAIAIALAATFAGSDETFGWFAWFVVALAAVAAIQAGSHTASVTIALVVIEWMAAVDDVAAPRALVVAACLLVFHGTLALMAVSPHSARIHPDVVRSWARRSGAVLAATVAVWLLVTVFERRDATANPLLTVFALGAVAAGAIALRRRSVDGPTV